MTEDHTPQEPKLVRAGYLFEYTEAELRRELRLRKEARIEQPTWWKVTSAPFRAVRWCWRGISAEGLKKFAFLCAGLFVVVSLVSIFTSRGILEELKVGNRERKETSATNTLVLREVLRIAKNIDEATSDEAAQRQTAILNLLVKQIRCNNQEDVQRLADELKKIDIPPEGTITLITEECARQIEDN